LEAADGGTSKEYYFEKAGIKRGYYKPFGRGKGDGKR
jgi:hypothetical protein